MTIAQCTHPSDALKMQIVVYSSQAASKQHSLSLAQLRSQSGGKESPLQIMLVDDNPLMEQVIWRFLTGHGYNVIVARSANDALDLAGKHLSDLLLIDLLLPDQDGPDLLHLLRNRPEYAQCPAIAMSGMGEEQRKSSQQAGFSDYLSKPIDLDELLDVVHRHLPREFEHVLGA